jgi:ribonuclease inhibitor
MGQQIMNQVLDFEHIKNKTELHEYLKTQLKLPEYYGNNLDALCDCLADCGADLCITLYHYDTLQQELGEYAQMLLQVFKDAKIIVEQK